jgi:hypothetical protein
MRKKKNSPIKRWTPEAVTAGLNAYLASGTLELASQLTGIPGTTISRWLHDPKNEPILDEARRLHARKAAVDAGAVWSLAIEQLTDRLREGDWRVSPTGGAIRIPVSAKDLAYISDRMAQRAQSWAEVASGGTAPADLSPEKAEALAREILRIDRELQRRTTVETTAITHDAEESPQASHDPQARG